MKRNNPSKPPRGLASRSIRPATILALLTVAAAALATHNPNPRVLPRDSTPYGKSYAEWHAAWWKWAFETPADERPVLDETGEFCHVGQSGPVWFLAGTASFGGSGSVERTCTVPAGKALFFRPDVGAAACRPPHDPFVRSEWRFRHRGQL